MKKWYQSKEVLFNIVMTIVNVAAVFEGIINPQITIAVQGIGTVILRVWFTNTEIEKEIV